MAVLRGILFLLASTLVALLGAQAVAYPLLGAAQDFEFFASSADESVRLLPDSSDPDLFYVTPKRVALATGPTDGRPLFRFSVTPDDGAEFVGVFTLQFDEKQAEQAWTALRSTRPNALVRPLPFLQGVLALDLQSSGGMVNLAHAEVVSTSFPHGEIPFAIRVPRESMRLIRMQLNSSARAFLTLRFLYKSNVQIGALDYKFRFVPKELVSKYVEHMASRWPTDGNLGPTAYRNYWMTQYDQSWDIATRPDDFSVRSASTIFVALLDDFFSSHFGQGFSLMDRRKLESAQVEALPVEPVFLDGQVPGRIAPIWGSAGILLSGLCARHEELVYFEGSGEAGCGDVPLLPRPEPDSEPGGGPADDEPWNPF